MRKAKDGEFRSSVYKNRPAYADFDAPAKFQAIQSIIAKHLREHPHAICSYSLKRTGCCGCAISSRAVEDLKIIEPYEPNVVKAAWNIFGDSYRYRQKYNEYKAKRMAEEKKKTNQMSIEDFV